MLVEILNDRGGESGVHNWWSTQSPFFVYPWLDLGVGGLLLCLLVLVCMGTSNASTSTAKNGGTTRKKATAANRAKGADKLRTTLLRPIHKPTRTHSHVHVQQYERGAALHTTGFKTGETFTLSICHSFSHFLSLTLTLSLSYSLSLSHSLTHPLSLSHS